MSEPRIHATAKGYQTASDIYEKGRPAYTEEAVSGLAERLRLRPQHKIVELGAGTGKFTRWLARDYPNIVAVEPVPAMREKLSSLLPAVKAVEGTGESVPVPDSWADAVVVANAFHWFDGEAALKEIHRILRPGGSLGLIWNIDGVFTSAWGKQIDAWLDELEGDTPQYKTGKWRRAFEQTALFAPLQEHLFSAKRTTTSAEVVDRVVSISFIAALPAQEREGFRARVEAWLKSHPDCASRESLEVSFDTKVYWCFKK